MDLKINKKNIHLLFLFVSFLIMVILSFKTNFLSGTSLWRDEAHAWTIAKYCSFGEIYKLMHVEGHMLLWYVVLKPFTVFNSQYYLILKFLNWAFMLGACIILIKYSKINPYFKCLIILSPIFIYFSTFARCYSMGIFFLFWACAIYKQRLEHPYKYFILLALAANTSILALFCALGMGIIFLAELYNDKLKNNRDMRIPVLITIYAFLIGIFLCFQFFPVQIPNYQGSFNPNNNIVTNFFMHKGIGLNFKSLIVFIYAYAALLFFTKPKVGFIYVFSMLSAIALFVFVYYPYRWHLYFLFFYLIISYWIYLEENPSITIKKIVNISMLLLLLLNLLLGSVSKTGDSAFAYYVKKYVKETTTGKIFAGCSPAILPSIIAELNKDGLFVYDLNDRNLSLYEGLETYYNDSKKEKSIHNFYNKVLPKGSSILIMNRDSIKKMGFERGVIKNTRFVHRSWGYYIFIVEKQ